MLAADQDRLIAGLENLHARQRSRNTAVLVSLTACSIVLYVLSSKIRAEDIDCFKCTDRM